MKDSNFVLKTHSLGSSTKQKLRQIVFYLVLIGGTGYVWNIKMPHVETASNVCSLILSMALPTLETFP